MAHKEGADEAIKDPNPTIDGRRANVNLAYLGAKNRAAAFPRTWKRDLFNAKKPNDQSRFLLLVSYSVLARMPTYPSTANAYPYVYRCSTDSFVNFFFYANVIRSVTVHRNLIFKKEAICLFSLVFFSFFFFLSSSSSSTGFSLSLSRLVLSALVVWSIGECFTIAVGIETIVPSIEMKVGSIMRGHLFTWKKNDILSLSLSL